MRLFALCLTALIVSCAGVVDSDSADNLEQPLSSNPVGVVPTGMPARLVVGINEEAGKTWMKNSGVPWDVRYIYLVKGWVNNWGWSPPDGSYAMQYMEECAAQNLLPAFQYYQHQDEPGGGELNFLVKAQNPTTMRSYFSDFKLLMQRAKEFNKPVLVLMEADGHAQMQRQSGDNPNAYAAVAATGLPELASLPNTVAGWGMAFLQLRKAMAANNVILGIHVSGWATGDELFNYSVTVPLQPHVDKVYAFLSPLGLAANQTGATYDVLVGDPLDRDADYYRIMFGADRWWNMSDTASLNSASFNRYAEWLRLFNLKSNKRWVLWQIPLGTSNNLNTCANGTARSGYKDNRSEYFFGNGSAAHRDRYASAGVIGLLFGRGEPCQANHESDQYSSGQSYIKTYAGQFLKAGGLAIPAGSGTGGGTGSGGGAGGGTATGGGVATGGGTATGGGVGTGGGSTGGGGGAATGGGVSSTAVVSPAAITAGATATVTATVTNGSAALNGGFVVVELYGPAGTKLTQKDCTGVTLAAGPKATCALSWVTTTAGAHVVKVGAFNASWGLLHWNDNAASFTVAAAPPPFLHSFEGTMEGWSTSGAVLSPVSVSTVRASQGTRSLAVGLTGAAGKQNVTVSSPRLVAGQQVTMQVWVPSGSPLTALQPFILEGASANWRYTGSWTAASALTANSWNTLSVQMPVGAAAPAQLGLEVTTRGGASAMLYVDNVR